MTACGGRDAMVMAPAPTCDSAVLPCFHGCPAFLHRHFPPQSPPSHLLSSSLHSQQQPLQSLNSSSQPLHLPRDQHSCPGSVWLWQELSDSHSILAATNQLFHSQPSVFFLWLRRLPWCGDRTPASVPPPTEGRSSPTNTPVFPPSSFVLASFACFYVFFPTAQVHLSALS